MNKIYIIITTLFITFCNAQVKNGLIQYGVMSHMPIPINDDGYFADIVRKANASDTLVNYTLTFNNKESCFFTNPVLLKEYSSYHRFNSGLMIKSQYYTSTTDSIHKYYENDDAIGEYVIAMEKEAKWTLTQETKMIDGYLCYKATSPFYNGERWFEDSHKLDVTAWYTTKIPAPFGPNGYHGLPGLIIELQSYISTFYIKKIDLNITPEPNISNLNNYKLITLGQKNKLLSKTLSPEMRKFMEDTELQKKEAAEKQNKTK
jgi:GLPGLI family protein